MDLQPRGIESIRALVAKGVSMPNPLTVDIAPDVDLDRISGEGVVIHPGCRIRGAKTVISAGVVLGAEGPVTIEDCRLGPRVELKGGYAASAVFLAGSSMGLGHHVREGTLLEEEASGAHCVGLKQTILFPYVTLGSLINFCDVLMAGGTSRSDHSEVGSSYIHFNFTPQGDKTTPSLFGDVARGVTLRERPIFLGGQGGTVGPVLTVYGTVVAAGSILRSDVNVADQLVVVGPPPSMQQGFTPGAYRSLGRLVAKNLLYLANLDALEQWYRYARAPFFAAAPMGTLVGEGALEMIALARSERIARIRKLVGKVPPYSESEALLHENMAAICAGFGTVEVTPSAVVVDHLSAQAAEGRGYLEAIHALGTDDVELATGWLRAVVDAQWAKAARLYPPIARLRRPGQLGA